MLIKADRTGRKDFGNKIEPTETTVSIAGVKLTVEQVDTWSSGEYPGDGEYIRCTFIYGPNVDPYSNIKDKPNTLHGHSV